MRIEASTVNPGWYTVHVDSNELMCDKRALPYPMCIGVIKPDLTYDVWTPAASKPRGYPAAAREAMESAVVALVARILVVVS